MQQLEPTLRFLWQIRTTMKVNFHISHPCFDYFGWLRVCNRKRLNCQKNLVIALYELSLLVYNFIDTTPYHLGRYDPPSPSTKELHRWLNSTCYMFSTVIMFNIKILDTSEFGLRLSGIGSDHWANQAPTSALVNMILNEALSISN